jgi:hypothetical protein
MPTRARPIWLQCSACCCTTLCAQWNTTGAHIGRIPVLLCVQTPPSRTTALQLTPVLCLGAVAPAARATRAAFRTCTVNLGMHTPPSQCWILAAGLCCPGVICHMACYIACRSAGCLREALALASAQLLPDDPLLAKLRGEYAAATAAGEKIDSYVVPFSVSGHPLCWGYECAGVLLLMTPCWPS